MEKSEEAKKKMPAQTEKPEEKKVESDELDEKTLDDVSGGLKKLDVKPGRNG